MNEDFCKLDRKNDVIVSILYVIFLRKLILNKIFGLVFVGMFLVQEKVFFDILFIVDFLYIKFCYFNVSRSFFVQYQSLNIDDSFKFVLFKGKLKKNKILKEVINIMDMEILLIELVKIVQEILINFILIKFSIFKFYFFGLVFFFSFFKLGRFFFFRIFGEKFYQQLEELIIERSEEFFILYSF